MCFYSNTPCIHAHSFDFYLFDFIKSLSRNQPVWDNQNRIMCTDEQNDCKKHIYLLDYY